MGVGKRPGSVTNTDSLQTEQPGPCKVPRRYRQGQGCPFTDWASSVWIQGPKKHSPAGLCYSLI